MAAEDAGLKLWVNNALKLLVGVYFVLTSFYCILAFLPYTYCALIKAPPYAWMPWFAHHQAVLYWFAAAAAVMSWRAHWGTKRFVIGMILLLGGGFYVTLRPFLPLIESNGAAYGWSVAALAWMGIVIACGGVGERVENARDEPQAELFGYSSGLIAAAVISFVYIGEARLRIYRESGRLSFHFADTELALWSFFSHLVLAIAVLSALNVIWLAASKTPWPGTARRILTGAAVSGALWILLARFLDRAMSFDGWRAQLYAAALSLTLTLWGFSIVWSRSAVSGRAALSARQKITIGVGMALLTVLALASKSLIGGEDWNGFVEGTAALLFWIAMSSCLYRLWPRRARYSLALVLAILVVSVFAYRGLQATEIFWGKALGSTDDEISLKFEEYGGRDASFQLVHHALGNGRDQRCGDLCRILREYTNIRDTHIHSGIRLVDDLSPAGSERPNIFIFVIDSMRPDYLGAYNPRVNYTPNIDSFARDSVVMRNVYSQYAGTSLSEPAIWAGALMLHAHYPQPFSQLNSLKRLADTDGYHTVVSVDEVLRDILPAEGDVVRLDTDKKLWNELELGSTLQQATPVLDSLERAPIFLYVQPKNVHQFARNNVPSPSSQHWQGPAGLNPRITYETHWVDSCLGQFFQYLKQRGIYDNSIIIVTSDHGDATGEFGRTSHSAAIWPEVMHVPLIIHLPPKMREHLVYDEDRLSTLTDITPTLYYLLGHRPIRQNALYGKPLFAESKQELEKYRHGDIFMASDLHAVYGILTADQHYLYVTYDSPAESYLFDLARDPNAQHNVVTPATKQRYDEEIIERLHQIADFYGYKPGIGSLLASAER